jgi:DNA-binding beta-propeller fold protein YncE
VSARARLYVLCLPALLAIVLAGIAGQAPVASASAARVPHSARSALAAARGFDPFTMVRRVSAPAARDSTPAASSGPGSFGSALVGSAPVQPGPSAVAVDRATNTIYVANGYNANGPTNPGGNTVSVIDGRRCNALDVSRCSGPWPTVNVGNLPSTIAVDQATDTVYVTVSSDNTVAVFNGATCNAQDTSGCGQAPVHVQVGPGPFGIFADDANHTVYVANPGPNFDQDTVSMINTLTCNASDLAGCASQTPPMVPVAVAPGDFDVNQATHTVYVATVPGVAAFDARTCNAMTLSGCGQIGILPDPQAPGGVSAVSVDRANNTIYAANLPTNTISTNTISAFDGRTCNADDLTGCTAETPGTVTVAPPAFFEVAFWLVVDAPLHTVYVVNQKDDTLSAVDTSVCNGSDLPACATLSPPTIHTGEDPESVALNPGTQTLYTANQVTNDVSVIDASRCNATITSGCRHAPTAVTLPDPGALAADPAAGTVYVPNFAANTVSMIDSRTCNAYLQQGCTGAAPAVTVGAFPQGIAIDRQTHTVYVANAGSGATGSVSVFDDRTCEAAALSGCGNVRTLQVPGGNAFAIAVNPVTDTIYVATSPASGPSTVSVFNGATCNATNGSGCGQIPQSVTVGFGASALAVNAVTDTIYVADGNDQNNTVLAGNTVSVIDGTICNATTTTGCGNAPQTITLGPPYTSPGAVAIDPATDTIYVADLQNGEGPGTVSVINGAACNAATSAGCGLTPPTVTVGFGPAGIAFDPVNRSVVVTNIEDTSVSVIDAATCNAIVTSSCNQAQPKLPAGRAPGAVAIDPATGTIYTSNGDSTVSIIRATR